MGMFKDIKEKISDVVTFENFVLSFGALGSVASLKLLSMTPLLSGQTLSDAVTIGGMGLVAGITATAYGLYEKAEKAKNKYGVVGFETKEETKIYRSLIDSGKYTKESALTFMENEKKLKQNSINQTINNNYAMA